ncbi:MAG TPA: lyase family protein [Myxococcota bacterium]|nr:lyase family protein [Myxococcota bacterium]
MSEARATRVEADRLGSLELPADALAGIHSERALRHLGFSGRRLADYPELVRALALVKRAAARANRAAGQLGAREADAIEAACQALAAGEAAEALAVDPLAGGGGIAVNMNANEVIAGLARRAGVVLDPKRHVNASQSTADVCATAQRLAVMDRWDALAPALAALVSALGAQAEAGRAVPTIARTCLRDGLATTLGTLFEGHAEAVARRSEALGRGVDALRAVNLGGTVIGSGEGAPTAYRERVIGELAALSGRALAPRASLYDAAQNADDLGAVSAELAALARALVKLGSDLRLLASGPATGFGEIELPPVIEGSSFFAGKSNPVVPETLLHCAFQVLGCDRAAQAALERAELQLNVFEAVVAVNVLDALAMLARAVPHAAACVRGLHADAERCRSHAEHAHESGA